MSEATIEAAVAATSIDEVAERVIEALRAMGAYGRRRARTQREVAQLAGTNGRMLQHATRRLLELGEPVVTACDAPAGMFLAETHQELADYAAQLRSRIVGNAARLKLVRRLAREWVAAEAVEPNGQRRLFAIGRCGSEA